jgi:hypothetical protein
MSDLVPGAAVLAVDADDTHLRPIVIAAVGDDGLTVAPVSAEMVMVAEWDLMLPDSAFGYDAFAETWNYGVILPEQVREHVAVLPADTASDLRRLLRAARTGSPPPADIPTGPPVLDDQDPRLLFQDSEGEAMRAYWGPVLTLAGAATLGELVRHRREELELPDDLVPGLPDLERDRLWLPDALPARQLAGLMRRLRVPRSGRLGRLARETLEGLQPALPRGPGPSSSTRPGATADQYVDDFLRELTEQRDEGDLI